MTRLLESSRFWWQLWVTAAWAAGLIYLDVTDWLAALIMIGAAMLLLVALALATEP